MSEPSSVLVTGGTGVLGRLVVARLVERGANVRVLSRRGSPVTGAVLTRGNLVTGEGVAAAVGGVDAIVHCASDPLRWHDDVTAADRLLSEAKAHAKPGTAGPHVVFVSIVGVDRIPLPYYRAKLAAEALIRDSGLPWTLLRATQFHDLILHLVATLAKSPVMPLPSGLAAQPVDTGEVADRLAELALGQPAGRVPDFGGPEVVTIAQAVDSYLASAGLRRRTLPVRLPGRTIAAFREGWNLPRGDSQVGTRTFDDFLAERVRPGVPIELTYYRRRRP